MRVLFIEDDELNRRIVEDMLHVGGAEMVGAEDAAAGLLRFDQENFDIVLVDLRMPGIDGFETIRRIRARDDAKASLPIVVVTADTGTTIREDCLQCGADAVLLKPVAMRELFETIADIVVTKAASD
ncbi:response regulator [Pacificimonas sp. ICDLI1SI03]|jgi:CheY-like chemotaxis protein|tara:strand:- start:106262 stop:106642 length:381 start_codon:yes stop_codon:yes gene_type:complete